MLTPGVAKNLGRILEQTESRAQLRSSDRDSNLKQPLFTGKPRRLVRYERLMLPWKTPSDEIFVSSCAIPLGTAADAEAEASFQSRDPERSVVKYFARSS